MPIIIRNVTSNPKKFGLHEYTVSINSKEIFRFYHKRELPLSELFFMALHAAKSHENKILIDQLINLYHEKDD